MQTVAENQQIDQQLNETSVPMWMMNMYTFYSKSLAQKMALFS